jgi:hypothetical protein
MSAHQGNPTRLPATLLRIGATLCVGVSGYLHAELYIHGYRAIPGIGPAFLLQASGSLAVALLLLFAEPFILRLGALALAVGALGGFIASRTVGVFGFVEHGLNPAPQALLSLIAEAAALPLLAIPPLHPKTSTVNPATDNKGIRSRAR